MPVRKPRRSSASVAPPVTVPQEPATADGLLGITTNRDGQILGLREIRPQPQLVRFDPVSGEISTVAPIGLNASGICFDTNGRDTLITWRDPGTLALQQGTTVTPWVTGAKLDVPTGVAVAPDGRIFVAVTQENARRVLQIGRALLANALSHTPSGTDVVVSATRAGGRALLAVSDDGPGIPAEHAEHVFDRFYRVDGAHASGSGLGLAIARELAEHMNGTVALRSVPGQTTFTLSLPAATVPAPELAVST